MGTPWEFHFCCASDFVSVEEKVFLRLESCLPHWSLVFNSSCRRGFLDSGAGKSAGPAACGPSVSTHPSWPHVRLDPKILFSYFSGKDHPPCCLQKVLPAQAKFSCWGCSGHTHWAARSILWGAEGLRQCWGPWCIYQFSTGIICTEQALFPCEIWAHWHVQIFITDPYK